MILVDGQERSHLDVRDRGLQYGDGLFETLAVVDGDPYRWPLHLERLHAGCERLGIPCPDDTLLEREAAAVCAGVDRAVLKLIITRGQGGRGYRPPADPEPTRILMCHPWPDHPPENWSEGVRVRYCGTRLGENPLLAGIKHLNRLEQVMARAEWDDPEVAEGLMMDAAGRVVDGTQCNLFTVRDGRLHTPDLGRCGVAGVARRRVLELAEGTGVPIHIGEMWPEDLAMADEVFLTNSVIGLWPVRALEEWRGVPGPLTRELAAGLERT